MQVGRCNDFTGLGGVGASAGLHSPPGSRSQDTSRNITSWPVVQLQPAVAFSPLFFSFAVFRFHLARDAISNEQILHGGGFGAVRLHGSGSPLSLHSG